MKFYSPELLWLIALVPILWLLAGRSQVFGHTQLSLHKKRNGWSILGWAMKLSKVGLWVVLCLALAQLHAAFNQTVSTPGGTIQIMQDVSGSMQFGVTDKPEIALAGPGFSAPTPPTGLSPWNNNNGLQGPDAQAKTPARIDASLGAIRMFIAHSHGLNIALTSFDDKVYYLYPATSNMQVVGDVLPELKAYLDATGGGGTNFDGPLGDYEQNDGALQGGINVLSRTDPNQTRIFIMVTDGDSSIDSDRAQALIAQYKALHIHMFVFGIGDDWASNSDSVQPLTQFVKAVGGQVTSVEDTAKFQAMIQQIDTLARTTSHTKVVHVYQDAILQLLELAAAFALAYLVLSALSREQI